MPKKLPKGISNYEELVNDDYYYVDKTNFIEKLESFADKKIMILRPRKFGKSLFVNMLDCYYNKLKKDDFEKLFGKTYIGKNPTNLRNSYCVLNFNFSGIDTATNETTIKGFKNEVESSINLFAQKYGMDFYVNHEQEAENILDSLFKAFQIQKPNEKIYVIIDEYDHFANELLGFHVEDFKNLVSRNGKVRKWYEILKKGTESVVDRIFITGVAPITLDGMTSGFNIVADLTRDERFNEIFGFTEDELIQMMKDQELSEKTIEKLLPIMRENYDGYKFALTANKRMYNSNMCLYFLDLYVNLNRIPERLIDVNIASDYKKLGNMLNLCHGEEREKIIKDSMTGKGVISEITEKFNPEKEYDKKDLISMLFYLGYLTIAGESLGRPELKVPNQIMKELYSEYFLETLNEDLNLRIDSDKYNEILEEVAYEGKIDGIVELAGEYLNALSNRDYMRFDEKYIKLVFFCIAMELKSAFFTKSESEIQRKYPDLLIVPKERDKGYYSVMIEFKYLKKEEESKLEEKQVEAKEQIKEYSEFEEIKKLEKIRCYTVVAINDKLYVQEV